MLAGLGWSLRGNAQPAAAGATGAPTATIPTIPTRDDADDGVRPAGPGSVWPTSTPSFTNLAGQAEAMNRLDGLVWALQARCAGGDAVEQRQCRQVRASRQRALAGRLFLVDAEAGAFTTGPWEPRTRSVTWQMVGCIRCTGIEVEGIRYRIYVGAPRVVMPPKSALPTLPPIAPQPSKTKQRSSPPVAVSEPSSVAPPILGTSARVYRDEAAAQRWIHLVENARVQFLVRVPASASWQYGTTQGLSLELVGYRAWNPCDGVVLMASDHSTSAPIDESACKRGPSPEVKVILTERPREEIARVMSTMASAAQQCRRPPTQLGTAKLRLTIDSEGTVSALRQTGDFVGTPLATCIDLAVRALRFPPGRVPIAISYPITLR